MEQKLNELQIRLLAIAEAIEGVEAKGSENWKRLTSASLELKKFANELTGKKVVDTIDE